MIDGLGIKGVKQIYHNLSYDELYKHELDKKLTGYEKGRLTEFGAVTVDTGKFTGRSPKDKYVVGGGPSQEHIWWAGEKHPGSDNKPVSIETWDYLYSLATKQLSDKDLYVTDGFCGANKETRVRVRLVSEVAWQAHFFKNMFIRLNDESSELKRSSELNDFDPDWTLLNAGKIKAADYEKHGLNSEVFVVINVEKKQIIIGGTWYGGEIKKGMFTVMHYDLPLKGIGCFHCSANMGKKKDVALFFGLSGTGKTTLSTDPNRQLIGDDEHGWDAKGIFNFEGGCYAKVIDLSSKGEPGIYKAIKKNALLENVVVGRKGKVDFSDSSKTQNTRVSYPIYHIDNIVKPKSVGGHPKTIVFLTCDSFGVLPPVSVLSRDQAEYWFLSGYTAKVAGTERGVNEPQAVFSACFSGPFLMLHPTVYAEILGKKMDEHGSKVYLVNTGWTGGGYGVGKRIDLSGTRKIVTEVLEGNLSGVECETMPGFGLKMPKKVKGVDARILNPKNTWADKKAYDQAAKKLAKMFVKNFKTFTDTDEGKRLERVAGPKIE